LKTHIDYTTIIIPFPIRGRRSSLRHTAHGFFITCDRCGNPRLLPWMAATIRDGREKVCTPCFLDDVRGTR
jgi:hypothetical protein